MSVPAQIYLKSLLPKYKTQDASKTSDLQLGARMSVPAQIFNANVTSKKLILGPIHRNQHKMMLG